MTIPAKYENGVFRPLQDVPIKEGTIVEVYVPVETFTTRPRSIGDSPFAGLWKDREDMGDSAEYINRLRRDPLIDVSRGTVGAIKYVDSLAEPWALSQVTAMEPAAFT